MIDIKNMKYMEYTDEDIARLRPLYELRDNKSCDAAPLTCFVYKEEYKLYYALHENKALTLMFDDGEGNKCGFLPYCKKEDMPVYFKLQEQYYNEELGIPLVIYSADFEGVEYLQKLGILDNYIVEETEDYKDYIYDANALRTLFGKKMVKKRNHINRFLREYDGRWEYRSLVYEDRFDIIEFEMRWLKEKLQNDLDDENDDESDLLGEKDGIENIVSVPELYTQFKMGGIYIDGELKAFSIGDYNEREKMAIISIEKADSSIQGLYQMINKEFLVHEFPDALIVNREDDVGIEGLRKSKMSYHPIAFERKYTLRQKVRFLKKEENNRTVPLFVECFGEDKEFIAEYYRQDNRKKIAVMEDEKGNIVSMAHIIDFQVKFENDMEENVRYIMCVATKTELRGKGYMKTVLKYVMDYLQALGDTWCFLVPVDKKIYKSLGFIHEWNPNKNELNMLYADEGLFTACAALLNADSFEPPKRITKIIE